VFANRAVSYENVYYGITFLYIIWYSDRHDLYKFVLFISSVKNTDHAHIYL